MHFTEFEIWQVILPLRSGLGLPDDARFDRTPIHLVVGTTDTGLRALGEASRIDSVEAIEHTLRELLGRPLGEFTPFTWKMKDRAETGPLAGLVRRKPLLAWEEPAGTSLFLMESLWLDALGKAADVPAHTLLGGAVRAWVPADYWAAQPDAAELAQLVHAANQLGCQGLKMKCDATGNTVRALSEIVADVPDGFRFTIDPMFSWRSLHESRKIFRLLERLDLELKIEDPFPYDAFDDWRLARQQVPISLVWHTRGEDDLRLALREGVADLFNIACRSAGEAVYLSEILAFHGKDCWFGSQLEAGVYQQVRLHSASVASTCVLPSDLQSQWVRETTLTQPPMTTRDGRVEVSAAAGLGVELNEDALRHYAVRNWKMESSSRTEQPS